MCGRRTSRGCGRSAECQRRVGLDAGAGEAPALPGASAYATFPRRLAAAALDFVITGLLLTAVATGLGVVLAVIIAAVAFDGMDPSGDLRGDSTVLVAAVTVFGALVIAAVLIVLYLLYFTLFTGWRGQTPGKMLVGIRVVDAAGEDPGLRRAFMREVVGKFLSSTALYVGFLWPIWDAQRQAWHDKIAETWVVVTPAPLRDASLRSA